MVRVTPVSTLFPYPTLFRSLETGDEPAPFDLVTEQRVYRLRHYFAEEAEGPAVLLVPPGPRPPRRSSAEAGTDRKSTRLNSSHTVISYAVFCLKKKN